MEISIELMTIEELESTQVELHDKFEKKKEECYNNYVEMLKLSEEYGKIEIELNKRKGIKAQQ